MYKIETLKPGRQTWVRMSNVPYSREGWTLEDCTETDPSDIEKIRSWINGVNEGKIIKATGQLTCGRGLLLHGLPGHGKTTLALSIIQELMVHSPVESFSASSNGPVVRPCYFSTFNEVLDLKGNLMQDHTDQQEALYYGMLGECDNDTYNIRILVIDDVGKEHATLSGWQKNMLHSVLRTRFNNGLPTIVTTNVSLEGWAGLYGDATASFANEAFKYLPIISTKGDLRQ
jgi:DNA replication protein DnaC